MTTFPYIQSASENALIVYFGDHASAQIAAAVQALGEALQLQLHLELVDLIPSYASMLVIFDPLQCDHYHVKQVIQQNLMAIDHAATSEGRLIEIPAYYHPDSGEDLCELADNAGISWEEVVTLHTEREYRVYAIGFAPGFAYLGDVDERIAAPRLATPRQRVPRGAVAIADKQTAVYPAVSPGGWNLIGRSALRMFDAAANPPMPVAVGDRVKFCAVDRQAFLDAGGEL